MTKQFWTSSLPCWKNIAPSAVSRSSAQPFTARWICWPRSKKGTRYDILFLDVIMPAENGITAAKEIRQYDNVVKIIFLTSSAEFAVESYVVGAYFYQLKPIWEDSFFRLTDSVIAECRRADQRSLILRCRMPPSWSSPCRCCWHWCTGSRLRCARCRTLRSSCSCTSAWTAAQAFTALESPAPCSA